jgi:ectoine hydroxylase-related dioxygenase (phytanoyl-CoA dioxygenase family)
MEPITTLLSEKGYAVLPDLLGGAEVDALAGLTAEARCGAGTRRLLDEGWCRELACRLALDTRITAVLPIDAQPVQCTLFAKSNETNWLVPLHQDLSLPVAERVRSPRCKGWSEKEGEIFVQPPTSVLNETLAVRVHLDDCNAENGALRVVPGSHLFGRLSTTETQRIRDARTEAVVCVPRGGAMLLRPLLVHASSKAVSARPRRVLHFVYGPGTLPEGLRWPAWKQRLLTGS